MEYHSQLVIGPDSTVLAASGDVPDGLVDVRLDDCHSLSQEVREVGHALLRRLRSSGARVATQDLAVGDSGRSLHLIAIEALALRRVPTDVPGLLASKLAVVSSQASTVGVRLAVKAAPDVPSRVHVDSEKLAWAVTTLVGNALRYIRTASRRLSGGTITVATGYDAGASTINIEVRDDGPGIPADTVARLFRRDGLNVRGSGLSLLLIEEIIAAHGGRVEVDSSTAAEGHGTAVRLTLPTL